MNGFIILWLFGFKTFLDEKCEVDCNEALSLQLFMWIMPSRMNNNIRQKSTTLDTSKSYFFWYNYLEWVDKMSRIWNGKQWGKEQKCQKCFLRWNHTIWVSFEGWFMISVSKAKTYRHD